MLLAHPEFAPREVPVPPVLVALVVFGLVILAARSGRRRARAAGPITDPAPAEPLLERLTPAGVILRILGLGLLTLGVVAGAIGSDDQLDNIAPVLLVGFGWPALLVLEVLVGGVFARLNPWDTLARLLAPLGAGEGELTHDVRPAVVAATAWIWYLTVPLEALDPVIVATAFGAYTLYTVAGCLAFGRVRWLTSAEVFTLLFGWISRARRGHLAGWDPPPGARAVIAVLAGGLLAGQLRDTHLYDPLRTVTFSWLWHTVALAVVAALVYLLLRAADRRPEASTATAAAVWVVVGLALALALARNRVLTSAQFLPALMSDPLGRGWDLFGTGGPVRFDASPLTETGRVLTQVGLVAVGALAAARVVAHRFAGEVGARTTPATAIAFLAWVAVLAFMAI